LLAHKTCAGLVTETDGAPRFDRLVAQFYVQENARSNVVLRRELVRPSRKLLVALAVGNANTAPLIVLCGSEADDAVGDSQSRSR